MEEENKKIYCKELKIIDKRYDTPKKIYGIIISEDDETLIFRTGKGKNYSVLKKHETHSVIDTDMEFIDESQNNSDETNNSDNTDNEDDYSNYDDEVQL